MSIALARVIDIVVQKAQGIEVSHYLRNPRRNPVELRQSLNLHCFAKPYSPQPSDLEPISAIALEQHARPDHQDG